MKSSEKNPVIIKISAIDEVGNTCTHLGVAGAVPSIAKREDRSRGISASASHKVSTVPDHTLVKKNTHTRRVLCCLPSYALRERQLFSKRSETKWEGCGSASSADSRFRHRVSSDSILAPKDFSFFPFQYVVLLSD